MHANASAFFTQSRGYDIEMIDQSSLVYFGKSMAWLCLGDRHCSPASIKGHLGVDEVMFRTSSIELRFPSEPYQRQQSDQVLNRMGVTHIRLDESDECQPGTTSEGQSVRVPIYLFSSHAFTCRLTISYIPRRNSAKYVDDSQERNGKPVESGSQRKKGKQRSFGAPENLRIAPEDFDVCLEGSIHRRNRRIESVD